MFGGHDGKPSNSVRPGQGRGNHRSQGHPGGLALGAPRAFEIKAVSQTWAERLSVFNPAGDGGRVASLAGSCPGLVCGQDDRRHRGATPRWRCMLGVR